MRNPAAGSVALTDDNASARQHWKWSFVAAMAGYIDAGSIVAGSVGLAIWVPQFGLADNTVGMLGAFSSNAISAGIGALLGGWICDKYGRKRIYTYDLLFYMFGLLWIIFAVNSVMLFIGYVIVGLAVGADIPASWSLITEFAPARRRGKLGSLSQILWNLGPVVTLGLGLALQPLGMLGIRLLFAHLFVVGLVTWIMRHGVGESARWAQAQRSRTAAAPAAGAARPVTMRSLRDDYRELLSGRGLRTILILIGVYGLWNLMAGTNGFYLPYLLNSLGGQSDTASVGLQCLNFGLVVLGTVLIFTPCSDRVNRRVLFGIGTVIQIAAFMMLIFFQMNSTIALVYILLLGIGGGFGAQHFFQLWSGEVFPTRLRSTAQGLMFAVIRIGLGVWSFFVPMVTASGFRPLAIILSCFLLASGLIGVIWTPKTRGKTLEQIELDYGWRQDGPAEGADRADTAAQG